MTKSELEEKIKNGEIIWFIEYVEPFSREKHKNPILHKLDLNYATLIEDKLDTYELYYNICEEDYCDLYGTEEEANWQLEFGNIERTERLKLPTWEEIVKDLNKKFGVYTIVEDKNFTLEFAFLKTGNFIYMTGMHDKPLTKENYIEACRLAKKLFMGE